MDVGGLSLSLPPPSPRANLSRDYFTDRQDRYVQFSDSRSLADFFSDLAETIAAHSYSVGRDAELRPALGFDHLSSTENSRKYRRMVSESVRELVRGDKNADWQSTSESGGNEEEEEEERDTAVFPLLQMGQYGVRQEEEATAALLGELAAGERLHLASGYFNLPPRYTNALLEAAGEVSVLAASPQVSLYIYPLPLSLSLALKNDVSCRHLVFLVLPA